MTKIELINALADLPDDTEIGIQIEMIEGNHCGEIPHVYREEETDISDFRYGEYGFYLKCEINTDL